jgi:hypothetical protein
VRLFVSSSGTIIDNNDLSADLAEGALANWEAEDQRRTAVGGCAKQSRTTRGSGEFDACC